MAGAHDRIVVDRRDLDSQISETFGGADVKNLIKVQSCKKLGTHIEQDSRGILITTIFKFKDVEVDERNPDGLNNRDNIIVLVDEGHRSHGGELHRRMRRAMPRAAYIAFTGTPLLKHEKTTHQFGPIVHAHTWLRAVQDGTVAPLLYEERMPAPPAGDGRDAQRLALIAQARRAPALLGPRLALRAMAVARRTPDMALGAAVRTTLAYAAKRGGAAVRNRTIATLYPSPQGLTRHEVRDASRDSLVSHRA